MCVKNERICLNIQKYAEICKKNCKKLRKFPLPEREYLKIWCKPNENSIRPQLDNRAVLNEKTYISCPQTFGRKKAAGKFFDGHS